MKDVSTKVKYHKKYLDYFLLLKELSIIIFFNRKKNLNSVDDRDKILFPSIPKLITIKDLKIGDVLFCNSDKFFSKIIQNSSEGSYCHCALYIGNNRVIDVVPNKLRISNISNFISEYKYIAVTSVPLSASDKEKLSINIEEMLIKLPYLESNNDVKRIFTFAPTKLKKWSAPHLLSLFKIHLAQLAAKVCISSSFHSGP